MHGVLAAFVVLALVAVPFGIAATGSAQGAPARDLTPVLIGPERTDRFGGGSYVAVKAGDTVFGVRYGTQDRPNNLLIFAEYVRFLGAAEIVDGQGDYLRTRGIPVVTVLGQSLDAFVEFQDRDGDGLLNLLAVDNGTVVTNDVPVKALVLNTSWELDLEPMRTLGNTTYLNFTLAARDVPYTVVWDPVRRPGIPRDGALDLVAFSFHLEIRIVDRAGRIPWYRVSVNDGNERVITSVEFLEWRNVTGRTVIMASKYNHDIRGWDFANETNLLALENHLLFGNAFPGQVARFVHMVYFHDHAQEENGTYRGDENATTAVPPRLIPRDRIVLDDDWWRVARFEWASNVTVDSRNETMRFQVQGGDRFYARHGLAEFRGFRVRAAFIYPNGQAIFHDPALVAESLVPDIPSGFSLTPLTILAVQVGIVAVALVPALYLRSRTRRAK